MLLALGPLQLDPTVRTVVVALALASEAGCIEDLAPGADAVWLTGSPTPDQVAAALDRTGLPVAATADDPDELDGMVAAGVVAVEPVGSLDVAAVAARKDLGIWCTPDQARHAVGSGAHPSRLVVEGGEAGADRIAGVTITGVGPASWGSVFGHVLAGVRVVRATDVRAVRRVVTVCDRLVEARAAEAAS